MDVSTPRQIGKSAMQVAPLGLGCGIMSRMEVSNEQAMNTVKSAWDTGVRFYDTSAWYGVGRSERRLGLALLGAEGAGTSPERDSYCINTKVGRTLNPEPVHNKANDSLSPGGQVRNLRDPFSGYRVMFDYSYERIMSQHWDSRQRLGHSRVDSLTIHDIDYGYHHPDQVEEHMEQLSRTGGGGAKALEELREDGAISAIGCGCNLESRNAYSWKNSAHEDLCIRIADTVDLDFFVIAGGYTLLETRALRRILPLCEERNIGVIIAAPYASGWLVTPDESAPYMYDKPSEQIIRKSRGIKSICDDAGVPLAAAAIQFPLAHPKVASVIPGAKSPVEPKENYNYMNTEIPVEVWQRMKSEGLLDAIAPTPE
jgi:D-threo-aldose 1-dehydrogenase